MIYERTMKMKGKSKITQKREKRKANMFEAVSAVIVLLVVFFLGSLADLSAPALIGIALSYVVFIGWRCGYSWVDMEAYTAEKIKSAAPAMSVLIAVGFLLGARMFSGTIPMFIYYVNGKPSVPRKNYKNTLKYSKKQDYDFLEYFHFSGGKS